jgi:hypothetical protein
VSKGKQMSWVALTTREDMITRVRMTMSVLSQALKSIFGSMFGCLSYGSYEIYQGFLCLRTNIREGFWSSLAIGC